MSEGTPQNIPKILLASAATFILLLTVTFIAVTKSKQRPGQIILPGGVTYLGPSPTPVLPPQETGKIPIPENTTWDTYHGKVYPYSFLYPTALSLGFFPHDAFDSVTIFWENTNAQENVFLRVENFKNIPDLQPYISKPKRTYIEQWWKRYNWNGVAAIEEFTNTAGLKGYRAKYLNSEGKTPFDNIFFEIPNKPELILWLSGRFLDAKTFEKIIQSVSWNTVLPSP